MSEALYPYYDIELTFLRRSAADFARKYPQAARRLLLEPNQSADPHVERLIESFALIAGRIHHKLDDEFPELTDAMLGVLYPHYLAPVPSMALVQFDLDPGGAAQLTDGFVIERHSRLRTPPVEDVPCRFRTGYPATLWPIEVTEARLMAPPFPAGYRPPPRTVAALRLSMQTQAEMSFADLSLRRLRFFLLGDWPLATSLYELVFNHALQVVFRPAERESRAEPVVLAPERALFPVGFERDEGLLPYPAPSFLGYRLLTEYFNFPHKFLFVELGGWERVRKGGFGARLEAVIFLDRSNSELEQRLDAGAFRLGCTPAVNLFEHVARPIDLTRTRFEYPVVPDGMPARGAEIYSVDAVTSIDPDSSAVTEYQPFYSFRHGQGRGNQQAFWYPGRRPTAKEYPGTDVFLNLVDRGFNPRLPAENTLIVRTTCTNRDLPVQLQGAGEQLPLELEAAAPLRAIRCLRGPTQPQRPPLRRHAYWRLISHLNLNHLSIADSAEARAALQEMLRLYDFSDGSAGRMRSEVVGQLIDGIAGVSSRPVVRRTDAGASSGFCRGIEVTMEFDEDKYVDKGLFLFASVLERFLGLYASINSFSQLVAKTTQGQGAFKKWPPRAGEQQLL